MTVVTGKIWMENGTIRHDFVCIDSKHLYDLSRAVALHMTRAQRASLLEVAGSPEDGFEIRHPAVLRHLEQRGLVETKDGVSHLSPAGVPVAAWLSSADVSFQLKDV